MTVKPGIGTRLLLSLPTVFLSAAVIAAAGSRVFHPVPIPSTDIHAAMPPAADHLEQTRLYGTPEGVYTAADIQSNGSMAPADRFRDVVIQHDPTPRRATPFAR